MGAVRRLLQVLGWIVILPLAVIVGARWFAWDSRTLLVGANAVTAFVLLSAWPILVLAAILRRVLLVVVAGIVVVAHVALVTPELGAGNHVPAAARGAPRLVLFDANVQAGNRSTGAYAADLRRVHPDLVVLEEASPDFVAGLDRAGALENLTNRVGVARHDPFAFAVLSRLPLGETSILRREGRPIAMRMTVETPSGTVRLLAVHAIAPFGTNRLAWQQDIDAIRRAARRERGSLLVVGDFNATWGHRAFRRLLHDGFVDGAAARGHPFQMTWPAGRRLPPFMRIDHVLTRGRVVVTDIRTGASHGSDHRPLTARIAVT